MLAVVNIFSRPMSLNLCIYWHIQQEERRVSHLPWEHRMVKEAISWEAEMESEDATALLGGI